MPQYVDPRYFQFGNAFLGGMQQAQEQGRRDELLGIEHQQMQLRNQQFAQQQQMLAEAQKQREAEARQMQAAKAQYAQLFESVGLDPGLAETPGAERLADHIIANGLKPPEQPKLVEDHTGRLVPEAPGVRVYHPPQAPKGPGQLYQVVGPDGTPRFVSAEEALGQQPFNKNEKPPVVADPAAQVQDAENVLAAIGNAKSLIGWNTTGFVGQKLGEMGGTDAYDLRSALDTVKASIGFDRLQRMREESKTGGALGQVAVRELDLLQATIASIDANQSGPQLGKNLERVERQYKKAMDAYQKALGGAAPKSAPGKSQVAVVDFSELPD